MVRVSPSLLSSLAVLPISFLAIPYVVWKSSRDRWYRQPLRPLLLIFASWALVLFVPLLPAMLLAFALIIWQSFALRRVLESRPAPAGGPRAWTNE